MPDYSQVLIAPLRVMLKCMAAEFAGKFFDKPLVKVWHRLRLLRRFGFAFSLKIWQHMRLL